PGEIERIGRVGRARHPARMAGRDPSESEQHDVLHGVKYIRAMSDGPAPTANTAPPLGRAPVRRHHWIVRVTHWATLLLVTGMVASGLQIYEAYARFGNHGGHLCSSPLHGAPVPPSTRLRGW